MTTDNDDLTDDLEDCKIDVLVKSEPFQDTLRSMVRATSVRGHSLSSGGEGHKTIDGRTYFIRFEISVIECDDLGDPLPDGEETPH